MDVATNMSESDWKEGSIVALTPWQEDLVRTQVPPVLRDIIAGSSGGPWDLSLEEAAQLAQWSDLLLFDYLTGRRTSLGKVGVQTSGPKKASVHIIFYEFMWEYQVYLTLLVL